MGMGGRRKLLDSIEQRPVRNDFCALTCSAMTQASFVTGQSQVLPTGAGSRGAACPPVCVRRGAASAE